MAHEIEFDTETGKSRMFAVEGIPVWHGLGQRLKTPPKDVDELLEVAGLDWNVEVMPIYRKRADGSYEELPDTACTVRPMDDRYLGSGGVDFHVVQNRTLAEIAFAMSKESLIQTTGSLRDGAHVWIMLKYPTEWTILGQKHEANLFLSNGHNWTRSLTIGGTDTDIVCANTLAIAESSRGLLRFAHTKNLGDRLKIALETIQTMGAQFDNYYKQVESIAKIRLGAKDRIAYFKAVAEERDGSDARKALFEKQLEERWTNGRGQEARGQTLYRAWSAVTDAIDHHVRPSYVESESLKRREARFVDATFGGGATLKRAALNLALDYAGASNN